MGKYAIRSLVAILAFCLGTGASYLSWTIVKTLNESRPYSPETSLPYSVLEGRTVRIKPYDATFEIPESWLTPNSMPLPEKNLYLSRQELTALYWNDGGDEEDAQVINAVLPFNYCAAHFGDRGWGNYFWNDLQGRVYVVDLTPKELAAAIETRGLQEASRVFEDASLSWENHGVWQKLSFNIMDAPTHFILMKNLDFYYRPVGDKTVVFVFLHAGRFQPTINAILNSFDWPRSVDVYLVPLRS